MATEKLFLALSIVIVSAMCLDSLVGTNMSLTATRQGTSDTFDVSLDFAAVDESGTAMEGATVYCRGFEKSMNPEGPYVQFGTTDAKGKFSYTLTSVSLGPGNCPKKDLVAYCYAKKGDTKTETVSDTAELTCYQTPTQTSTLTPIPTPDCPVLVPCAPPLSTRLKGYNTRGCPIYECVPLPTPTATPHLACPGPDCPEIKPTPTATTTFCTADVKLCPDGSYVGRDPKAGCEFYPCPSTTTSTPTATPTPAGCGNTHTGAWPATCSSICSAAGKTCMRQSSCDGKCVNNPCASSCDGSGDIIGCVCATPTPAPVAACGDTDAAVVSGSSDNTCSVICSSFGKTCVGMSSCDGSCISASCSHRCGSAGAVAGCKCS